MRNALLAVCLALAACAGSGRAPNAVAVSQRSAGDGPRVLAVFAHPDDETVFAATLYKIGSYLGGTCDAVVITDGEAGFKYSTLAEAIYGAELTDERVGRAALPSIRRKEMLESARILGLRSVYFLDQADHRYTTDVDEVLGAGARVWNLALVRSRLREILAVGRYDFVFALAPTPETHAHHKAATVLATEAALAQPDGARPVVLVAQARDPENASALSFAAEESNAPAGPFVFERTQKFGYQDKLDYRIVVNWVIAAHKSQGTMQLDVNRGQREEFFLFGVRDLAASRKAAELFERLRGKQFAARTYSDSAGTNVAKPR